MYKFAAFSFLLIGMSGMLNCAKIIVRKPTISVGRQNNQNICANHGVGEFVRNPNDCKLFYLCMENGEAITASCPPTMLFNPESHLCDRAENVNCIVNEVTTASPTTPATSVLDADAARYCAEISTSQQSNQITFIGSRNNCNQYYICYYGQALLQECSSDLHWNSKVGKCDIPANAGCTTNPNLNLPDNQQNGGNDSQNGNTDRIDCPFYGQHIFPHMKRCDYFIYCVKGHPILQQCPFFFHFDVVTKNCKWRTSAVCVHDLQIGI